MVVAIGLAITAVLVGIIACFNVQVFSWFWSLLFKIGQILLTLVDFLQSVFRRFAGLSSTSGTYDPKTFLEDNIVVQIITSETVKTAFISILAVGLALIFIGALVQSIRVEYTTEGANNTRSKIFSNVLKSFMLLILVPVVCVFGVVASGYILLAVDNATGTGSTKLSNVIFVASFSHSNYYLEGNKDITYYPVSGNDNVVDVGFGNYGDMKDMYQEYGHPSGNYNSQYAALIDAAFKGNAKITIEPAIYLKATLNSSDNVEISMDDYYSQDGVVASWSDYRIVYNYYQVGNIFNFIMLYFACWITLKTLFSCVFGLVSRLYKIAIYFIVMPGAIALHPIDEGKAYKIWKDNFMKAVMGAYGIVISLNIFFTAYSILSNIQFFTSGELGGFANGLLSSNLANGFVSLIILSCGISLIPKLSGVFSGWVGGDDVNADGESAKKATVDSAKSFGKATTKVGSAAFKMGSIAVGGGIALGSKINSTIKSKQAKKLDDKVEEKTKAKEDADAFLKQRQEKYDMAKDVMDSRKAVDDARIANNNGPKSSAKQKAYDDALKISQDKSKAYKAKYNNDVDKDSVVGLEKNLNEAKANSEVARDEEKKAIMAAGEADNNAAKAGVNSKRNIGRFVGNVLSSGLVKKADSVKKGLNAFTGGQFSALGGGGQAQYDSYLTKKDKSYLETFEDLNKDEKIAATNKRKGHSYLFGTKQFNQDADILNTSRLFNKLGSKLVNSAGSPVIDLATSINNYNQSTKAEDKEKYRNIALEFAEALQGKKIELKSGGSDKFDSNLAEALRNQINNGSPLKAATASGKDLNEVKVDSTMANESISKLKDAIYNAMKEGLSFDSAVENIGKKLESAFDKKVLEEIKDKLSAEIRTLKETKDQIEKFAKGFKAGGGGGSK